MACAEHCLFCLETLAAHLEQRDRLSLADVFRYWAEYSTQTTSDAPETSVSPPAASPLFVTWNLDTRPDGYTLRGCIGTFEPQPLDTGLAAYALTSALQDTRFRPIAPRELPALEVAVTLLTDFEDAADAMDWELGTHGLRISFSAHGKRYGATYLPDVAPEQGWTKEETLVSLMRKAGWMGKQEQWQEVDLRLVRYQGRKKSLRYAEYKQWRDWVTSQEKTVNTASA